MPVVGDHFLWELNISRYSKRTAPKSFIHVDDFSTIQELADYLIYLDKNETAYLEYLDWKFAYQRVCASNTFCEMCQRLHKLKGTCYFKFSYQ